MAQKYGRKIKRAKNLYAKRKDPLRRFLEIAGMIALVGVLGFVGFSVGKPLLEYLGSHNEPDDTQGWTPPADSSDIIIDSAEPISLTDITTTDFKAVLNELDFHAIFAPTSVLSNSTSLSAYIQQIKSNGYNSVVFDMKDSLGGVWYLSEYELLADTGIIKGTLSAKQIYESFNGTGVTPVVRINTTLDSTAPKFFEEMSYRFEYEDSAWIDDKPERGGKYWGNPFLSGTRDYISFLVKELSDAGFSEIILANNLFPYFRPYDESVLKPEYTDKNTRYKGLVDLVKECYENKGSSRLFLEMSLKDVLESSAGFGGTAEILRGKDELSDFTLLLTYGKNDFGTELVLNNTVTEVLPNSAFERINILFKKASEQTGSFVVLPGISSAEFTDNEMEQILFTLSEMGYDGYIVR